MYKDIKKIKYLYTDLSTSKYNWHANAYKYMYIPKKVKFISLTQMYLLQIRLIV